MLKKHVGACVVAGVLHCGVEDALLVQRGVQADCLWSLPLLWEGPSRHLSGSAYCEGPRLTLNCPCFDLRQLQGNDRRAGSRQSLSKPECTVVAAMQLRIRMRILMRPDNSLATFSHQISNKKLRIIREMPSTISTINCTSQ